MKFIFEVGLHYWICLLCREPEALGKGLKALGKGFAESLPRGSRQRALGKEALGKEFFAESHVEGSRQRLCRGPETPSAKPTAPSKNVNVNVVFAESQPTRLSAKTFLFFLEPVFAESLDGRLSAKGVFAESLAGWLSAKTFYYFFKKIFAESQLSRLSAKLEIFFVYIYIYIYHKSTCLYHNPHIYHT
jgi:hypothetical protein